MMTWPMTSQGGIKVVPLYSLINEITTFFMITKKRSKISSSNFLYICIMRLWLQLHEYIFMTSLMMSPGHKVGQILKLIYLLQYLNYSVDQKLKMSEMLMAIFLVYSTSGITSGKKVCRELKMAAILKILNYQTQLQFDLRYENIVPNYAKKSIFMMMTSSMTSQGGLKVGPLYTFIYEITTFFMITKKQAKISSLNFLCICIMRLWLPLYKYIFMTSLMTSPGYKIGQNFKMIYLRQYVSYSVGQKFKMSEMLMAFFLVYSTSGITSGKKSLWSSKWRLFWKFWNIKHSFNLTPAIKS